MAPGAFTGPYYLESSDGLLFVNDRGNHRIQIFYEDGRWAGSFGGDENCESSSELGRLDNPHEFAVTGSFIYVTDLAIRGFKSLIEPAWSWSQLLMMTSYGTFKNHFCFR